MADHRTWAAWISEHRQDLVHATKSLLDACTRGVRTVAQRYPGVYFELGCRTDEAMMSLIHSVFTDLDGREFGRFPFSNRTPYDTFHAESMTDDECRYHSFNARLSVTREALRQRYQHNVRRHPAWLQREALHRSVMEALEEDCVPFPGRHPSWPRYGLPAWSDGLRAPRADWNPDAVVRQLRRREGWSVSARVQIVLSKHGAPMYPGAISRLLQDAAVAPDTLESTDLLPSNEGGSPDDRLAIRLAAADSYASLTSAERALLVLLLAGRPYKDIAREIPGLGNPSAVTRALGRICDGFLAQVLHQLGTRRTEAATLRPKAAAELLLSVLVTLPGIREQLLAADEETTS
ncbi:MAG: hypothetical protein QGH45_21940 [Myxococcota bacterium]|nr:hypothetical protein [Myxococcota bacterium]